MQGAQGSFGPLPGVPRVFPGTNFPLQEKKKKTLALELKGKTVIISPGPERAMLMKMEFAAEVAEVALP